MNTISFEELCKIIDFTSETMDNYMYVMDFNHDCYHISERALSRFALTSSTFHNVMEEHRKFVYKDDFEALKKELDEVTSGKKNSHCLQYRWLSKEGMPIWITCRGNVILDNGSPKFMVGCINEIGASQKADNKTGMLMFTEDAFLNVLKNPAGFEGFIMRIGIDDLRGLNSSMGNQVGDYAITITALSILDELEAGQFAFYVSGDEFIIISFDNNDPVYIKNLYERIRDRIDSSILSSNYKAIFSISAGIVSYEDIDDELEYDRILKYSSFALQSAKELGRNTLVRFNLEEYDKSIKRQELSALLRNSIENNFEGFDINYQLLISPDGQILGAESLMRYKKPDGTPVPPFEFIPLLEKSGLIIPAGRWIMRNSMIACKKIQKLIPGFRISINVSHVQVAKTSIVKDVSMYLDEIGLRPDCVMIELTESGFLESDIHYMKTWRNLKKMGVLVALDDFGTGYSNFHYLSELKPNVVKVDRSFTYNAVNDPDEYSLLLGFTQMAKALALRICIEGIENEDELMKLSAIKPTYYQGFYFGRPCTYRALVQRLRNELPGLKDEGKKNSKANKD